MWKSGVKIKHLMTKDEDHESVQRSMNAIADVLDKAPSFRRFDTSLFREIPESDGFFSAVEYANHLIDRMYDFADAHRIWIE